MSANLPIPLHYPRPPRAPSSLCRTRALCLVRVLFLSLVDPGLGYASVYKVLQKSYKFGTQPVLCEQLRPHINDRVMASAVAGSLVGAGEVVLLPFDVLKIRSQTKYGSGRGLSFEPAPLNP